MPDTTITAPVAADPIDRLVLGATEARAEGVVFAFGPGCGYTYVCFAED